MTAIQETSREAYHAADTATRRGQVLEALRALQPACSLDISDATGIPPNVVTPRVKELRESGAVVESHRAKSRTGRTAIHWRVVA